MPLFNNSGDSKCVRVSAADHQGRVFVIDHGHQPQSEVASGLVNESFTQKARLFFHLEQNQSVWWDGLAFRMKVVRAQRTLVCPSTKMCSWIYGLKGCVREWGKREWEKWERVCVIERERISVCAYSLNICMCMVGFGEYIESSSTTSLPSTRLVEWILNGLCWQQQRGSLLY